jgi:hydrogenase nickel incorporation protein HypA/HybF
MHEMSLAESVLQIVEDHARKHGFARVNTIFMEVGQLAGVEVEALRFALEVVTRGSVAEGAAVDIAQTPGQAWCLACGDTVAMATLYDGCSRCGGYQVQVTGGTEMRVKELAVD